MVLENTEQYKRDGVSAAGASTPIDPCENIINFDAIWWSMWKCKKGVMWKNSVASFVLNGIERSISLSKELYDGSYKPRPSKHFTLLSPKKRDIISITFRDRIYQRSLNDNSIYPIMTKSFIYDNLACQQNKGTDKARNRMKCFLQRMFRKFGKSFWVLQIDIKGYYPNMRHDNTERVFASKLPYDVSLRVNDILHEQYEGDIGYNPGSQLIQIAGISVLNDLDHRIKEDLHIKNYIRYMDDLIILHPNRMYLESCKDKIESYLSSIGFRFNPKKTKVYSVGDSILFLGFTFSLTNSGKVLMQLNSDNVRHERRKLRKLVHLYKLGRISKSKVYDCYNSWRNHASKGNNYKLCMRMDAYLKSLWGENNAD